MQCFTRRNKYPRTTNWATYIPPPPEAYNKRKAFVPEPDKNGRPWCPDAKPHPKHLNVAHMQYNPLYEQHRERKMDKMLEFINKTNWTTGQDVKNMGPRRSRLSDTCKYSLQSTTRADYPPKYLGKELRRCPNRKHSEGATPATYHLIPYLNADVHPLTNKRFFPEYPRLENPNKRCHHFTVPHFIPDRFPGTQLPAEVVQKYKRAEKPKVSKMGWAE